MSKGSEAWKTLVCFTNQVNGVWGTCVSLSWSVAEGREWVGEDRRGDTEKDSVLISTQCSAWEGQRC